MKKLALVCFIALLGIALTVPVYALENQFGGYFRTRMFNNTDFDGNDETRGGNGKDELQVIDSRTRLYYTAIINDNLKFVNKFELDADWGDGGVEYGDIGADGIAVEVKNSYIDFNLNGFAVSMGTQGATLQRGFLFGDDFSGIVARTGGFTGIYMKIEENTDASGDDVQAYHGHYDMGMGDLTISPNLTYVDAADENYSYFLGVDLDGAAGGVTYWGTFIYQGGEVETTDEDISAFLIAAGVGMDLSDAMGLHFEAFYATGDDDAGDDDIESFANIGGAQMPGQSYYWSEIMGYGLFDDQVSTGSPADKISNILAANVGVDFKLSDDLSVGADIWYAQLAEDNANGDKDLGTEIDLSATYTIVEGLKLDVVAAYLLAGDATTLDVDDDADPFEVGAQFSISF